MANEFTTTISRPSIFPQCATCTKVNPSIKEMMSYIANKDTWKNQVPISAEGSVECHDISKTEMVFETDVVVHFQETGDSRQKTSGHSSECPGLIANKSN